MIANNAKCATTVHFQWSHILDKLMNGDYWCGDIFRQHWMLLDLLDVVLLLKLLKFQPICLLVYLLAFSVQCTHWCKNHVTEIKFDRDWCILYTLLIYQTLFSKPLYFWPMYWEVLVLLSYVMSSKWQCWSATNMSDSRTGTYRIGCNIHQNVMTTLNHKTLKELSNSIKVYPIRAQC